MHNWKLVGFIQGECYKIAQTYTSAI